MEPFLSFPVAVVKLLFSGIFLISAWQKISDAQGFGTVLAAYRMIPMRWLPTAAWVIAIVELILGVCLLTPQWGDLALVGVATLLLCYAWVMWHSLNAGRGDIDCGCSGATGSSGINNLLIVRNLVLAVVALLVSRVTVNSGLEPWGWVFALLGAVALLLLFHTCNQLIANQDMKGRLSHHA